MSGEDPGLLGNLPRSRPGRRSEKRAAAASGAKRTQTAPRRAARAPREQERAEDPVGEALKLAGRAAGTGLRVANGVTRGVLRRLPRP